MTKEDDHSHPALESAEGLRNLLARLELQSLKPDFQMQRQLALRLVLQPYLDPHMAPPLFPLPEEEDMAKWYLYADYFPTDGHSSLIEQVRDLVTEHVPEEERVWLDFMRHSYMDLLEVQDIPDETSPGYARLCSLGDQQVFHVLLPNISIPYTSRHVLLTRLIRGVSHIYLPGPPLVLSATMAKAVFELTNETRRELEFGTGNFALSEWAEFAKSYGYLMIWSVAKVRRGAWSVVEAQTDYVNTQGELFLYAIAVYEHQGFRMLADGLKEFEQFTPVQRKPLKPNPSVSGNQTGSWVWLPPQEGGDTTASPLARLTLTPTQLFIEADSPERLDIIKHQLAAIFGFSLHFLGETTNPPQHTTPEVDLLSESYTTPSTVVSQEEEQQILASFLESVYLEWAEKSSPLLNGQSPRHYCAAQQDTKEVAVIIDHMEHHDLGRRRTGNPAYDYNILRAHIGL